MGAVTDEQPTGPWIAYYYDWSGAVCFESELEALRHAVDHSMEVKRITYGVDLVNGIRVA